MGFALCGAVLGGRDYEEKKDENTNTSIDKNTVIEKHKYKLYECKRYKCLFAAVPLFIGFCTMQYIPSLPLDGGDNEEYK